MSITIQGVSRHFGDFTALDDVSVEIPSGSLTALLGPSGSGKSTLLRVVAGLERPDAGSVELDGRDATGLPPQRRGVGFVFQHYAAFKHMTVRDNVAFGLKVARRPKAEIKARVAELLELVQLPGLADRYPSQLSGGQRQRMARVRKELRAWLRHLHDEVHVTTVFVTHDQEEAMEVADRIVVMNHGRIEQVGGPRDLYEHPSNAFVMGFVGPVTRLGEHFIRPHDVEVRTEPNGTTSEAMVERLVHLGFEVRADLVLHDGQRLQAQLSREDADQLELALGQIVFVRPSRTRVFSN
jgi:sulfate transport system ATP-binding protein